MNPGLSALTFSEDQLSRLFPFYLLVDSNGYVSGLGRSFIKLFPISIGVHFDDVFVIKRPTGVIRQILDSDPISLQMVIMESRIDEILFRGQWESVDSNMRLFVGTPWFGSMDDVVGKQLTIHDFAIHDPMIDLLHVLKTKEIATADIKVLLARINEQRNILKRDQVELQRRENMLRALAMANDELLSNGDFPRAVYKCLTLVGQALGIYHAKFIKSTLIHDKLLFEEMCGFWSERAHPVEAVIDDTTFSYTSSDWIFSLIPEIVKVPEVQDSSLRTRLLFHHIDSVVTIPILHIGSLRGYLRYYRGTDDPDWSDSELSLLKSFSNSIASALDRSDTAREIYNMALFAMENPDPVIRVNMRGEILMQNKAAEDIKDFTVNGHKFSAADFFVYVSRMLFADAVTQSFEALYNGKTFLVVGRLSENGKYINIYVNDITEKKRLEVNLKIAKQRAEESSKAKESFLANMSHEIRTPLNAIIGMIRELTRTSIDDKQRLFLNHVGTASQHLLSIVNNILDISKIEAGQFKLEDQPFSLYTVFHDVEAIMLPMAREKMLDLKFDIATDLAPAFCGDAGRIRQVLLNLLGNSIKFTAAGSIAVRCTVVGYGEGGQSISIVIIDTGIGMDESYQVNLFKKFSQEDASIGRRYGGTGLGMAITHELIQLMNGRIEVVSEKGTGTQFEIFLTLSVSDIAEVETMSTESHRLPLRGKRVLLVEDNELNRLVARHTLDHYEMTVVETENGKDAIEVLKNQSFDIVLMDLQMPVMGGLEAVRIIRQGLGLDVPVIALTANAIKTEITKSVAAGMNDYVTKPFEEGVLINTICKCLAHTKNISVDCRENEMPHNVSYDLSLLSHAGNHDREFVSTMIKVFCGQVPDSIRAFNQAVSRNDYSAIRRIAHKMKPSLQTMGIHRVHDDILFLEGIDEGAVSEAKVREAIQRVNSVLQEAVSDLLRLDNLA